ncbi:MAG: sensor histidine kinase [Desulfobacterales bacterium]|nr:MAG: sensor histidine kinase [Desulfobacterales bacterium]
MSTFKDSEHSSRSSPVNEQMQTELDLRLFHLQTLYDVSREILGEIEVESILKNFLLMTLGNFGVAEGFILTHDTHYKQPNQLISFGFQGDEQSLLMTESNRILREHPQDNVTRADDMLQHFSFLQPALACAFTFLVEEGYRGILGLGAKIVDKPYSQDDQNLLETLINNLVVSLKNARAAEALKKAYEEVTILNRAKDKLIHHLSHELQTPVALLISMLKLLKKQLASVPRENWKRSMERAERNLQRLVDMQTEVEDILQKSEPRNRNMMGRLLDQCADALEVLIAEQVGDEAVIDKIRNRIDEIFGARDSIAENIILDQFVKAQIEKIRPLFSHRTLKLIIDTETTPHIFIPSEPLEKLVIGLVKNAIENTPDEGKIEVTIRNKQKEMQLVIQDRGVGIVEAHQQHIFEGFFPTRETIDYSSKRPFDFNAGGKGADLLRMKIFSERFNFNLDMTSSRCRHIPSNSDVCPGRISQCNFCRNPEDCYTSGGTTFIVVFPASDF